MLLCRFHVFDDVFSFDSVAAYVSVSAFVAGTPGDG